MLCQIEAAALIPINSVRLNEAICKHIYNCLRLDPRYLNAPRSATSRQPLGFLRLTDGLTIARIADILRCCTRTVRNYIAGRSPIPWHRIEILRLLKRETTTAASLTENLPIPSDVGLTANIDPDPSAPDVPPAEVLAWVGVHAPHFLSSQRSFEQYVRGWNVVDKIRRAKTDGTFAGVLARWRVVAVDLLKSWRSGRVLKDSRPPAYHKA